MEVLGHQVFYLTICIFKRQASFKLQTKKLVVSVMRGWMFFVVRQCEKYERALSLLLL